MKKLLSLTMASLLSLGMMSTTAFATEVNVTVDGTPVVWTDAKPFINADSRTLVPLRPIADALGLAVTWNADTRQASFSDGTDDVVFTIGSSAYQTPAGELKMDTAAVISNSRTFAPARYLAESFGYTVGWDNAAKTVTITSASTEETADVPDVGDIVGINELDVTVEAGAEMEADIIVIDRTFLEEPDFFEYPMEVTTELEFLSSAKDYNYFAEGRIPVYFQPYASTVPGTYPVELAIPAEWFADDLTEDVVVTLNLTVTAPSLETVMAVGFSNIQLGIFAEKGWTEEDISAAVTEELNWPFYDTVYRIDVSDGVYDAEGATWSGTLTAVNGETNESISETYIIPIEDYDAVFGDL